MTTTMTTESQLAEGSPDPVTVEIVRYALLACAEEMMANLKRAAYGPHIYEASDCVAGLFDSEGNTVALAPGSPMMLVDLGAVVRDGLRRLGRGRMELGDIIASNDPYTLGTHSSNMALYSPIFVNGELVAFTATRAHWIDTGGAVPGGKSFDVRDIWQEGFQFRHLKLHERGEPVEDMMRFIADNVRMPDTVLGDMRAQVAACHTGERRFASIIEKFGSSTIRACTVEMFRRGEELARKAVEQMPDGEYSAEAFLDDDGVVLGKRIPIRVKVAIRGSDLTVDYSDMSEQVPGPINTGVASAQGIASFAFKAVTTPHEAPNEGHFKPLHVVIPPGKIISAQSPAPTCWWSKVTNTTIDTILAALAQAIPDRVPAAHVGDLPLAIVSGRDPRHGNRPFIFLGRTPGGYGARPQGDGESCTHTLHEGDTQNIPIEVEEHEFPIRTEYATIRTNSEGPGQFRGGFGYEGAFRVLTDAELFIGVERTTCPPWGIAGGLPAQPNTFLIDAAPNTAPQTVLKAQHVPVAPGTLCVIRTGGGGGYGPPVNRDPERVLEDVRLGYITVDHARDAYGVVIDARTLTLDLRGTKELRHIGKAGV